MPLTDTSIKAAIKEANDSKTETKKFDEGGLYLLLKLRGGKCRTWWRLKYRFGGKERGLSLGVYPTVTLKRAREKRDEAKALLADGVDPSEQRKANKLSQALTFQLIAEEWLQLQSKKLSKATMTKSRWLLDDFLAPAIGSRPIAQLGASDILPALRKIEARGTHETAHRAKQLAGRIFRYAVATGRTDRDPTADLRGALAPVVTESHAAITDPTQIGQLLRAIDGYQGQPATGAALKLAPIFFVRPGELRGAEWSEFDLTVSKTWRIPGPRMKMGEPHLVPLPTQAITVLQSLQAITGEGRFLFPSIRTPQRPMSEKHDQRGASSTWVLRRRNDGPRIPCACLNLSQ